MFQISQLKKKVEKDKVVQPMLPELTEDAEMNGQPEMIIGTRWNSERGKEEVLVEWENQPKIFPEFHLEHKVSFAKGGIVRPLIIHTYHRRGKKRK